VVKRYRTLIAGEWVGDHLPGIEVINPFDDTVVGIVPMVGSEEIDRAIRGAKRALAAMAALPAWQRADLLERTAGLIRRDRDEIAGIIAREAGKAWKYALTEADRTAETFAFAAHEARKPQGELVPMDASAVSAGRFGYYLRTPVGVVGAISPFNFPFNLVAHKVAPALAAGNTVVLKPAPKTPLSAIKLAELLVEAGIPEGALSVVIGGAEVGEALVTDDRLAMISFTGSPAVGRKISARAGLKRLALELGASSPTIIDADADLDFAVSRCVYGSFANSGQICVSVQRIYLHRSVYEAFLERFVAAVRRLKVGDPLDPGTDVGPMISRAERERTLSWIDEARSAGARVETGGEIVGNCLLPTVLSGVTRQMKVICAEAFAPVVSLMPFDDFDEALAMANDSLFGLQAGVFTRDIGKAFRAVRQLHMGGVIINDVPTFRVDQMPYGGVKESGLGREGVRYAMEEMSNIRMVCINHS